MTAVRPYVVHVVNSWTDASGGLSLAVADFARALPSYVVSFTREGDVGYHGDPTITCLHVPFCERGMNRYAYTRAAVKAEAEKMLRNAALIVCHGLYRYQFDWAVRIAGACGIPYWVVPHGALDPYVFTYRAWYKRAWLALRGRHAFRGAQAIIFATDTERDKAAAFVPIEHAHVINWPVTPVDVTAAAAARSRIRQTFDIPHDSRLLLFFGRIHPSKRPLETVKAVASLTTGNVHLLLAGPDSDILTAVQGREFCREQNITNVRWAPPVFGHEKYDYFMAADAFVSLSHRENFGYTVAEALSTGLPVILSPGNDLGRELRHIDCGWLLPDDSMASAQSAIEEFATTPEDRLVGMGNRGRLWAGTALSRATFEAAILELAREALAAHNSQT